MLIIAISGVARSGKDFFASLLRENLPGRTYLLPLAKKLKDETSPVLRSNFGIDIDNLTPELKELVRDFWVAWGKIRRQQSNCQYFTDKVFYKFNELADCYDNFIVTDLRYATNENDELATFKKNGAVIVHVKRYEIVNGEKVYIKPPNKDELENDSKLEAAADYCIEWPTDLNVAESYAKEFIAWLDSKDYFPRTEVPEFLIK